MLRAACIGLRDPCPSISRQIGRRCKSTLIQSLKDRGLVKSLTSPTLEQAAEKGSLSLYCGVDPTAPSLHVGNLLTLIPVLHFHLAGHNIFTLVGGATGQVGDPAGKNAERDKLASDVIQRNVGHLTSQLERFIDNGLHYAKSRGLVPRPGRTKVVNNADWYSGLTFLEFMRDVGRNVRVGPMLARDSVKNRMAGEGMSYGEFSYQLLQAYDYWHLYKTHGVRLQIGGSDQYGNITAGTDLIGRLQADQEEVFGLTVPLLTTPSGEKFGKSAGNAIWLDPDMTSPFDLYQYFFRTPDSHIEAYLRLFTLLPFERIDSLVQEHSSNPSERTVNHTLAAELVSLIHGSEEVVRVRIARQMLIPSESAGPEGRLSADSILHAFEGDSRLVRLPMIEVCGQKISSVLQRCGLCSQEKRRSS